MFAVDDGAIEARRASAVVVAELDAQPVAPRGQRRRAGNLDEVVDRGRRFHRHFLVSLDAPQRQRDELHGLGVEGERARRSAHLQHDLRRTGVAVRGGIEEKGQPLGGGHHGVVEPHLAGAGVQQRGDPRPLALA